MIKSPVSSARLSVCANQSRTEGGSSNLILSNLSREVKAAFLSENVMFKMKQTWNNLSEILPDHYLVSVCNLYQYVDWEVSLLLFCSLLFVKSPLQIIVNRKKWYLWNSTKFFVVCFCSLFWSWPCTKHNSCLLLAEELTNGNVLVT